MATHWDAGDLRRRLAAALEVAERAVRLLGPAGYRSAEPDGVRPEKVLSETALFLLASHPACRTDRDLESRHRHVCDALLPYARNDRVAALIVLEPIVALDHALVHLCLSRIGLRDEGFDRLLAAALASPSAAARERLPHRVMEQQWLRRLANGNGHAARTTLPRASILRHPLDALCATADDVYAFTHALMFGSDLAQRELRPPRSAAGIAADAETALARCLDEQDYDLGGEVLLTWPFLRRKWSAAATFGFLCLTRVEDEAGFLPSHAVSLDTLRALTGEDRTRYAVAMSYHTVYVMGLLCAVSLRSDGAPPVAVPAVRRDRGIDALLAVPDPDAEPRHWVSAFADLSTPQRNALAPLVLAVRLRRAARRRDLAGVKNLLRVAARYDLLDGPAPQQALALLQRVTLLGQ